MIYVLIAAVAVAVIVTVGIRCDDDDTDYTYRYPTPRKPSRWRLWLKDAGRIEFKRKGDEISFHIGNLWIMIFVALIWWVLA